MNRVPDSQSSDDDDDERTFKSETHGASKLTNFIAEECRKRAFSPSEHKTISTIAAEVLGRMPPTIGAVEANLAISAFLSAPINDKERMALADTARVAVYALCEKN